MTTYYLVVVPALILAVFGLVMGFSALTVTAIDKGQNPYTAYARPLLIIVVSLLLASAVQLVPTRWLKRSAPILYAAAIGIQMLVITPLGVSVNGNTNWVKIGPIQFQPSEFLKLGLVIFLGFMLSKSASKRDSKRTMAVAAGLPILLAAADVMLGGDLGTMLVVVLGAVGALWVAGLPVRWFGALTIAAIPTLVFLVSIRANRLSRVFEVLPGARGSEAGQPSQVDHSLWALGSGGLTGLGPGASREKWNYLQEAHTDFILAIVGEEFGLFGTLAVVVCLGLLIWGTLRVAWESSDLFVSVVSAGVASFIGAQTMINVLSVTRVAPVVGVPLPLVSYGGSSFTLTIMAIAVVASFARARAGMWMIGQPDEAAAGRDPRVAPRRRAAR